MEGVVKVGETLEADPHGATVSYQWMRSVTDDKDGDYEAITGATAKTYTLTRDDVNKWIKVEVKGTGNYTGTKTSDAVGPVEAEEPVEVPSTYSFSFVEPDGIVANEEATIDVTFANDEPAGDYGYDKVRFKFSVTGPGSATFSATDSVGNPYEATNEGYWGPSSGFAIGAEYSATTPWTVTFSAAGQYTITVSLIEAPDGEVVAGITETFTVNVQAEEPEEPSIPELTVSGPSEEVAGDAENFEVTFAVTHDKELAYLEIDHNLGKHGSLPSEDLELPEFKLYPNAANPWATDDMDDADARKQYAESQGLVATYDANEKTWTLTFGNPVLAQIRNLTAEYTNNEFRIYSLVRDVDGNQSGSMYDGSYEITVVRLAEVEEPVEVPSTYSFSFVEPDGIVANEEATIDVTFANDEPAGDYGYDKVRFKFSVTGPGSATFSATDSVGNPYEATNEGYWGPSSGFAIGAEYSATTPWTVTFSAAGQYTITVSLIEAPDGEVVANITETFTVNVEEAGEEEED